MHPKNIENGQLKNLIAIIILSSIPSLLLSIYIGYVSKSLSVFAIIMDSGISLLLNIVSYHVLNIISKSNVYQFPYGTGKLENFTSFFHGCSILLLGFAIFYQGINRINYTKTQVSLDLAQLALLVSLIRISFIVWKIAKLAKNVKELSPILSAYYINFKAAFWYLSILYLTMLICWGTMELLNIDLSLYIDITFALCIAIYLMWNGGMVVQKNFRALIDLPISESDMLKVMKVVSSNYDAFENISNVYTNYHGCKRIIQIEITLKTETTIDKIEELRNKMNRDLIEQFDEIEFHLIAREASIARSAL